MKRTLCVLLLAAQATAARAYVSVDCSVRLDVSNRITRIDIDPQIGAERLQCVKDGASVTEVRVVRAAKASATARADAQARARGEADARYSDSCSCSCQSGSCSCHTSGSGSDSCSSSRDESVSRTETVEVVFAVARAPLAALSEHGFSVQSPDAGTCRLADGNGAALDILRAVAAVTWVYGEGLMRDAGAELRASEKLPPRVAPAADRARGEAAAGGLR